MSAVPAENHATDTVKIDGRDNDAVVAGMPVVVRRNAGLAALIGAAASAVAIAYLWRASQTMTVLDWGLCAVMAAVAAFYLSTLVDSRTPLLVADDLGVRIRLGHEWRGLPWDAIEEVAVHPQRGLLRDGRLVFVPHSLARALEGLEGKGKRHAAANQKMYGAALAVPIGITTRVSTDGERGIAGEIAALSLGRARVLAVEPVEPVRATPGPVDDQDPGAADELDTHEPLQETETGRAAPDGPAVEHRLPVDDRGNGQGPAIALVEVPLAEPSTYEQTGDETPERPLRPSILGGIGTIVSRVAKATRRDTGSNGAGGVAGSIATFGDRQGTAAVQEASAAAIPLRETRPALRAQVTRDTPATQGDSAQFDALHEGRENGASATRDLHRPGSVDLVFEPVGRNGKGRVRPISQLGDAVEPLVIDDFVTEPAYDPVIGPELAAARTRLGLSVDEIADRTRIRPHVIESIEVDDFAPCGGDFYARGHLRTLARVLGKDVTPMLERFEERYATAPINARRVFEAELATGMTGSMRSTMRGPNWGLLIGAVLAIALVWGVVRLFSGEPAQLVQSQPPVLNGSVSIETPRTTAPVDPVVKRMPITLVASQSDTSVVIRNGNGMIVYSGELVLGERKRLLVVPPVRVHAADAGALEVVVAGQDKGLLGVLGEPATRIFR